jgi:hypothetical protein
MYAESLLITRLQTTGYIVEYAEDTSTDLINIVSTTPRVYVGHVGIKLQYPNQLWSNGYNELDNPEILLTSIQYICDRINWHTVRSNIAAAYKGFTPFANDGDYSSMVFVEASVLAKTNTKVWGQELVGIIFPRFS